MVNTLRSLLCFIFVSPLLYAADTSSNILLHNGSGNTKTVYGLYVRQWYYVTPGASCASATPIFPGTPNETVGAQPVALVMGAGQRAPIGQNLLYNMLLQAGYYVNIIIPSSPPGCALPGCTWGSDTTQYNWCIELGALGPVQTSTGYTSNVPPSTDSASSAGVYNYNLIDTYVRLGPIQCNDQTLTCAVSTPQTQSFP